MYKQLLIELKQKYKETGRVGFIKPKNNEEAIKIIKAIAEAYISELKDQNNSYAQ